MNVVYKIIFASASVFFASVSSHCSNLTQVCCAYPQYSSPEEQARTQMMDLEIATATGFSSFFGGECDGSFAKGILEQNIIDESIMFERYGVNTWEDERPLFLREPSSETSDGRADCTDHFSDDSDLSSES
ncbi:MAG: hypothetical protein LBQ43_04945 [Holosporales bacterium]|nr:hypothetical protein [Holosporales bacterium]